MVRGRGPSCVPMKKGDILKLKDGIRCGGFFDRFLQFEAPGDISPFPISATLTGLFHVINTDTVYNLREIYASAPDFIGFTLLHEGQLYVAAEGNMKRYFVPVV